MTVLMNWPFRFRVPTLLSLLLQGRFTSGAKLCSLLSRQLPGGAATRGVFQNVIGAI